MRSISFCLLIAATISFASCHKGATGDIIIKTGKLERQGTTTYMYGTHILFVHNKPAYVLESKAIDLDRFVGRQVLITAEDEHYHAETGPDLYKVTSIAPAP